MDNLSLFFLIFSLSNHSALIDTLMIFGARFIIYLTFLLMFILSFKGGTKERKALIVAILAIPIIILLIKGIHIFFYENRPYIDYQLTPLIPPYEPDASFPSRHASIMSGIAFAYIYFKSKWAPLFLILLLWVGISRIYVGVHYPLDILGGIIVGLVSAILALQLSRFLKSKLL